jgi:uncharacterized protein
MARRFLSALLVSIAVPLFACAYTSPGTPTGYVNDLAGVLSVSTKDSLEQELKAYDEKTTNQITVVTVQTIGNDYIENYAVKLFEEWKIGTKAHDNGVLILIAVQDRKMRIEVGYGLEGVITDTVADRIIRDQMVPQLRQNNYDAAVQGAVHTVMSAAANEYAADSKTSGNGNDLFGVVFFFGLFGLQWLAAILGRTKEWWLGGVLGFASGSAVAFFDPLHFSLVAYALMIGCLTAFGFFFDYIVSSTYNHAQRYGYDTPWWSGGNSGFGGGTGGGFGGFGGGSSGGGGASGSW